MKHLFALLLLSAALLPHSSIAQQQSIKCNTSTGANCNTETNPGNGNQGDPAWLSFGKTNANFTQIFTMLGNTGTLPAPAYGIQFNNNGTLASLIPGSTGTWCFSWSSLSAPPTLVSCGSGSGTVTSVGVTVPSWLSVSGSPVTSSGTIAISGTIEPNNYVVASAASGSQTVVGPRALVVADIPTLNQSTTGNAATASALAATPTQCSGDQFSTGITAAGNANCGTPAGGNVSSSGTPTAHQTGVWVTSTTVAGVGPGASGQAWVSNGASADPAFSSALSDVTSVNGTTIPASATLLTSGGALGTPSSGSAANLTSFPTLNQNTTGTAENITGTSNATLTTLSALSLPSTQITGLGTFAAQNYASPPIIGGTTPAAASFSSLTDTGITGSVQCVHVSSAGLFSGTGSDCGSGSGGVTSFSGDGSLFNNSASTGAVTATLANTGVGYGVWGNIGAASGAPGYHALSAYPLSAFPTLNQATTSTAANVTATSNSTLTTLSVLSLPSTQVTGLGTFATQSYASPPAIGGTTPAAGAFTTLSASGAVSGTGFSNYLASPPAIGGTAAAAGTFTALTDSGITGSTQCLQVNTAGLLSGTGAACGGSGSTGANPTGTIGLAAVNGSATTFLRSDGAPALSQAITPTWTGLHKFTNGDFSILGSSTGYTLLESSLASTTNNTLTLPATATDTLAAVGTAQTFTAAQTFTNADLLLKGSTSGSMTLEAPAIASTYITTFPANTGTVGDLNFAQTWSALQTFGTNISIGGVTASGATGTGNVVFATSPTLTTPALGTPSAAVLTNATGLPISTGVSGLGTGVATFLATPSSANLASAVTDETGTGALVFGTSPTLVTPALGTPASGVATNLTGTAAALNIGGNAATATTAANLSGTPALPNGTTATTQTTGDSTTKIATDAFVIANAASAGVASVAAGSGIAVTGTGGGPYTGAVTVSASAPNRTVTSSPTVASTDMGGQINSNVSGGGTLTIPAISSSVFPANSTLTVVNYSASTETVSTTPTVNAGGGCVSGTGIPAGATWNITSNGTTLDCNQTVSAGGGSGTVASSTTGQIPVYTASTTVTGSANATLTAGALTLGVSGTAGSIKLGNATSGTVTIQPVTGALGSAVFSVPTGTLTAATLTGTETLTNKTLTAPTMTAPVLGTPASGTATNLTGLPISTGVSGLATGMAAYLAANTTFTITPTGCTPSAHAGGAFGGTITLATGPCTSVVVTMNGATGYTAAHGFDCSVDDQTTQAAGTWIPKWGQSASSTTTATIPIPAAAGATDVISFSCAPN